MFCVFLIVHHLIQLPKLSNIIISPMLVDSRLLAYSMAAMRQNGDYGILDVFENVMYRADVVAR